jgi:hypothetical protein
MKLSPQESRLLLESGKGKRKHSDIKLQTVKQMA